VSLPLNKTINIKRGDILSFGKLNFGVRCYLAVKDGFQTENVMNSYSYFNAVTRKAVLQKGDQLIINPNEFKANQSASIKIESALFDNNILECNKGPEFDLLNPSERESIFNSEFEISPDNNRMGYRLKGMPMKYPADYNMLTSAVLPGTAQLTPSGQMIVLMRDCQTTGGYPRTLQLTPNAINILSQKKAADRISFRLIS
jgi:allophanate hydrolase subunit 2